MWQTIQTFIETNPTLTAIYSGAIGVPYSITVEIYLRRYLIC